jgi:secondary thiamine-phosphate synthase enzyme
VTTIEYESGAVKDLKAAVERIAPRGIHYHHDARWGDGNGFAHVRAALLGPSLTVPFASRKPLLGTWQQIVLVDFDNRPRTREVIIQVVGE